MAILEENSAGRQTLDCYACQMFSSRQRRQESLSALAGRINALEGGVQRIGTWCVFPKTMLC
jgi:hypothetical protein